MSPSVAISFRVLRNRELENARRCHLQSNRTHYAKLARHYQRQLLACLRAAR